MRRKVHFLIYIRCAVYLISTCDNSLPAFEGMSLNRNHHGIRSRDRIYNARGNGLFTWHVLTIFISRAITWNTRGVVGNTYYHENICKSLSRDVDVGYSPFASLFRATFFHLQSPCHPAAPCAIPAARIRRSSPTDRAASHRIYGTYGGRYVLWLIVLLSLTYFQFTAAARRFASWLSIVRDERRFMCHPGLYLGLRPGSCFIREMFVVSNMINGISSW